MKYIFSSRLMFLLPGLFFLFLLWMLLRNFTENSVCEKQGNCPNIVLIILDDMPWSHFGSLSKSISVTPNLDDLAKRGFLFRNIYNTNSRCRASLATYLTGQLPHQNLIYSNQGVLKLYDDKALIRVLSEAGYATFVGGKMWEGNPEQLKLSGYDLDTFHFVRKTQSKLIDFLDRYSHQKPLFVWWAPLLPHKNHNAPEAFVKKIDPSTISVPDTLPDAEKEIFRQSEQAFLATISWVDEEIGNLILSLEERSLMENTWIIVLSDNGWSNFYPAKGAPYDIGVRTPLIIKGPDVSPGSSDQLLSSRNLYGSVLHLAGLEATGNRKEDVNFFTLVKEGRDATLNSASNVVYWASYPSYTGKSEPVPRAGRDVYALSMRQNNWQYTFYVKSFLETGSDEDKAPAIIHTGWHQKYNYQLGDEELFDLSSDPFSEKNLSGSVENRSLVMEYRKMVFNWWKNTGGKEIDSIQNCQKISHPACEKYYEVYPDLLR